MTKPLLVFDLDGTLAETAPDLVATLNQVLADIGVAPVTYESARDMVGGGARLMIERALAHAGVSLPRQKIDQMFDDFLVHYDAHIADASTLFPGVVAALDRFEAAGWHFAVCTNKITKSSELLLEALGVADRFTAICGKDSFPVSKPDARALLSTIDKAGGARDRTIMVGDFEDRYRDRAERGHSGRGRRFRLHRPACRHLQAEPRDLAFRRIMGCGRGHWRVSPGTVTPAECWRGFAA